MNKSTGYNKPVKTPTPAVMKTPTSAVIKTPTPAVMKTPVKTPVKKPVKTSTPAVIKTPTSAVIKTPVKTPTNKPTNKPTKKPNNKPTIKQVKTPTRPRLPEFHYMIPVRYDSAFRSKVENERLRKKHSTVKSIHVKPRTGAIKSPNGTEMIKLIIAAPNKKLADDCFADGNGVIRSKMENNARKGVRSGQGITKKVNRTGMNISKVVSVENKRPMMIYPETVTGSTDWSKYMDGFDAYQKKNPNYKVV